MIATQNPFRYSALRGPSSADQRGDAEGRGPLAAPRKGRVLVVDDEPAICASLKRLFSRQHTVLTASSARAALELFRAGGQFDVVLCDLMMPEMSGLDLYTEIHRASPDQASRFVFMSGASLSSPVVSFLASIPNRLLTKPFDMRALSEVVREHLK